MNAKDLQDAIHILSTAANEHIRECQGSMLRFLWHATSYVQKSLEQYFQEAVD